MYNFVMYLPRGLVRELSNEEIFSQFGLTKREMEVALLACEGLDNCEIAEKLFRSEKAIKYHIGNIYKKLDIKNRNKLIVFPRKYMDEIKRGKINKSIYE